METITPAILADELIGAAPSLSAREQHLAVSLYRLLAEGQPVERSALADRAGVPTVEVDRALVDWPGVFTDEQNRVIGFLGFSIRPTPHRLTLAGRRPDAWCADDTPFLP